MDIKAQLLDVADAQNRRYPQYRGHFDSWHVGRVRHNIKGKGGTHALKGDSVLVRPEVCIVSEHPKYGTRTFVTIYSARTRGSVSVKLSDIDVDTRTFAVKTERHS